MRLTRVDCEGCKGTGEVDCPACDGSGFTSRLVEAEAHGHAYMEEWTEECRRCRGSGKESCEECEGTGDIVLDLDA